MSSYRRGHRRETETAAAKEHGVHYLRVSSVRQTHTGSDVSEHGNSIDTQREECDAKANQMGVTVVREFVEPGKSAQTIDKRPQFRLLLAYLAEHPEIGYVFVYSRSRAFRNIEDAILTRKHLRGLGVKIVSTKEDFGDSLEAEFMETISDTMNDLQNRRNGEDVRVKMGHKAKNGGTIGRAPIGYLNTRLDIDGRLVNTVITDEDRAPLVRTMFELYASGEYTLEELRDAMTDQGLAARPFGRWKAERPLSKNSIARILADPYYLGYIYYDGELYDGRHEALVSQELFDRVQDVMDTRSSRASRQRVHHHYLKGLLRCGRCHGAGRESRLIYTKAKGRTGGEYEYYLCRGRQQRLCDLPHLAVWQIEDAVLEHYRATQPSLGFRETLTQRLDDALAAEQEAVRELHANLTKELGALEEQEDRMLDLLADGLMPQAKLRERLMTINRKKKSITEQMVDTSAQLAIGVHALRSALTLAGDAPTLYETAPDEQRARINQAIYIALYLDEYARVHHDVRTTMFEDLRDAGRAWAVRQARHAPIDTPTPRKRPGQSGAQKAFDSGEGEPSLAFLLDELSVGGSSREVMVGPVGLEPTTYGLKVRSSAIELETRQRPTPAGPKHQPA